MTYGNAESLTHCATDGTFILVLQTPPIPFRQSRNSFFFLFFCFLGPHMWHMEVPRIGVELELQLPAYTTATAMRDLTTSSIYTTAHSKVGSLTY